MAKVTGPLHSSEARGAVGSLTYNSWRGLSTVKARSGPAVTMSDLQKAIREITATLTSAWKAASDAERAKWNAYAEIHPDGDWTGQDKRLSGYNQFVRLNFRRWLLYASYAIAPPTAPLLWIPQGVHVHSAPADVAILWTAIPPPPSSTTFVQVYLVGPHSAGANPGVKMAHRWGEKEQSVESFALPTSPTGTWTAFLRPLSAVGQVGIWQKIKYVVT